MKYEFETEVPCPYTTHKDISDRLHGTVCRYKGRPVWVTVDDDEIFLYTLDKRKHIETVAFSEIDKLDVSSLEIGYLNYDQTAQGVARNKVIYCTRGVKRQWKQALTNYNISYATLSGEKQGYDLLNSKCFEDMLEGNYPSFEEALQKIGRDGEMAISQDVALKALPVGIVLLYLRGKNLGWIAPNSKNINLEDRSTKWVAQRQLSAYGLQVQ